MKHHKFRFEINGNFKVLMCRIFGHRLNDNVNHHWCNRCGLAYEKIYHPYSYRENIESRYIVDITGDNGERLKHRVEHDLFQLIKIVDTDKCGYRKLIEDNIIYVSPKNNHLNEFLEMTKKLYNGCAYRDKFGNCMQNCLTDICTFHPNNN